jgi:GDP/UDP-N,N'-diacetylbacillosamine 2-epimerase (hydrolysing)
MMDKRKVLYISGTRADYGLMRTTLRAIVEHPGMCLEIAATGMHLMAEFGLSINEIKADGFKVREIGSKYERDDKSSMASFTGGFIKILSEKVEDIKPDIILVLGDRAEMLGGAIIGAYMSIPVAHVHGGEVSSTVDEFTRHAITKLSHIHLPATKKSAERIIKMGEEPWRVHTVGAPGLDQILSEKLLPKEGVFKRLGLNGRKPIILVLQHPVSMESGQAGEQMRMTLKAVFEEKQETVVIYPNADAGGREMISVIEEYRKYPFIHIFKNLPHDDYLCLLKYSSVLIGNSSSGIIEAPSFRLPVVNIGSRQEGRERAINVIDAENDSDSIKKALDQASSPAFMKKLASCSNPYGDGKTGPRIAGILAGIKIDNRLLQKKLAY